MAKDIRAGRSVAAQKQQPSGWFESFRGNLFMISVIGIIVFAVVSLSPTIQIWLNQRQEIADYKMQVAQAQADLKNMQVQRDRWDDPVYIRSQARSRLYYVLPGEVSFLVMDADGATASDTSGTVGAKLAEKRKSGKVSKSITETKKNWVDNIVESVIRSGIEEPVVKPKKAK